ncbi:UNVERIFIED_CONTAM: hypothetical protein Sradi_0766800 [Sesamum radiatum]|uniref:DUF7054 domain-containing protein n=1 Tax=Sesamum radiatum TaxID=300843 RepID=A0AAW2VQ07_SESRA
MRKDCSKTFSLKQKEDNYDDRKRNNMEMNIRNTSDKTLLRKLKKKKGDDDKNSKENRFLITINVFGSAGPIRFVVNEDETAQGYQQNPFSQFTSSNAGGLVILEVPFLHEMMFSVLLFAVLKLSEVIGSRGVRNFVLCRNQSKPHMTEARSQLINRKGSRWRAWFQKSLTFKILSH